MDSCLSAVDKARCECPSSMCVLVYKKLCMDTQLLPPPRHSPTESAQTPYRPWPPSSAVASNTEPTTEEQHACFEVPAALSSPANAHLDSDVSLPVSLTGVSPMPPALCRDRQDERGLLPLPSHPHPCVKHPHSCPFVLDLHSSPLPLHYPKNLNSKPQTLKNSPCTPSAWEKSRPPAPQTFLAEV